MQHESDPGDCLGTGSNKRLAAQISKLEIIRIPDNVTKAWVT